MEIEYKRIARLFAESELCIIEDALEEYIEKRKDEPQKKQLTGHAIEIHKAIQYARRWKHQLGKVER